MTTDITIDSEPTIVDDFGTFASNQLAFVAKAIAVAIDDRDLTVSALEAAVRAVRDAWPELAGSEQATHYVFAAAIEHGFDHYEERLELEARDRLIARAGVVTHEGLQWSDAAVGQLLGLPASRLKARLALAGQEFGLTGDQLQTHVQQLIADAEPVIPDLDKIDNEQRSARRRTRRRSAGLALVFGALVVALFAQFVSRSDRPAVAERVEPAAPTQAAQAPERASEPEPERGSVSAAEPQPAVPWSVIAAGEPLRPELIAEDGRGGFIGVQSPSRAHGPVIFSRSPDGTDWSFASQSQFGEAPRITRFERSGDHYVVWIDGVPLLADDSIATIATSQDLASWDLQQLDLPNDTARGLVFTSEVGDVSVSGDNVLALIRTTVEIDFGALSLSEGYTCGRTISRTEVSVNLCNAELDVLSLSALEELPSPTRLYVSRGGERFEPTRTPFGDDTAAKLTNTNGLFVITNDTGVRFATSADAITWRAQPARAPLPILAAASNADDELVGIGDGSPHSPANEIVLFHHSLAGTRTVPVAELVGEVDPEVRAVVAAGPTRWVVYLYEPFGQAWLLSSADGVEWDALSTSPPTKGSPRLLVGDNEALLQWVDGDSPVFTLGVPLP